MHIKASNQSKTLSLEKLCTVWFFLAREGAHCPQTR